MTKRLTQEAVEWQKERCAELEAALYIHERMRTSVRQELVYLQSLRGAALMMRFGWESPTEVAKTMEHKNSWLLQLGTLWIENVERKLNHGTRPRLRDTG